MCGEGQKCVGTSPNDSVCCVGVRVSPSADLRNVSWRYKPLVGSRNRKVMLYFTERPNKKQLEFWKDVLSKRWKNGKASSKRPNPT